MRRGTIIFLIVILTIIGFLVNACSTLIGLLFEDGAADAIPRAEIPAPDSELIKEMKPLIPKIIHQTYINESIPEQWKAGQQSCLDLHKDYEYMLWTDEKSREFILKHYSWFIDTFDNYPYPIQRADTIRYFVLSHYGGIYIDLDDGCNRRLDPLLSYPAWVRRTVPTGISNDAMGSVPNHPFFKKTIDVLQSYNRRWGMPYITVMYSTGPLFLSVVWKEWMSVTRPQDEHVRILMGDEYKGHTWSFFNISKGSSWHGKDAQTIFWMGQHWMFLTVAGFALAGVLGVVLWWCWTGAIMRAGSGSTVKRRSGSGSWFTFWRWGSRKEAKYELVDRMA